MITNAVAGTYCVPGTTCMACVPGTTCTDASTAPCTQTASGQDTCSCSASPVPESTVCVPWGRLPSFSLTVGLCSLSSTVFCIKIQSFYCYSRAATERHACFGGFASPAWHTCTDLSGCIAATFLQDNCLVSRRAPVVLISMKVGCKQVQYGKHASIWF